MCTIEEKNEYLKQLAEKDASIEAMKFKAKEFITKLKNENQATITQLQQSLTQCQVSKELAESKLIALQSDHTQVQSQLAAKQIEIDSLSENLYNIQCEMNVMKDNSAESQRLHLIEVNTLKQSILDWSQNVALLESQKTAVTDKVDSLQLDLKEGQTAYESTIFSLNSQLKLLQIELENRQSDCNQELVNSVDDSELPELRAKLSTIENELVDLRNTNQTLLIDLENEKSNFKLKFEQSKVEYEAALSVLTEQCDKLQQESTAFRLEISQNQIALENNQLVIDKLIEEKKVLNDEYQATNLASSSEIVALKNEIAELSNNLSTMTLEKEVADNLVTSLQVSLNECKSSFESAVSNLDQLQHRSDAEINQIQLQFADTQEEKKLLLDKISNLNDEIIMLKETNLQLTKDLKDERQKYQDDSKSATEDIERLNNEKRNIETKLAEIETIRKDADSKRSTVAQGLVQEVDSLNSSIDSLNKENSRLKAEKLELDDLVTSLRQSIIDSKAEFESNIAEKQTDLDEIHAKLSYLDGQCNELKELRDRLQEDAKIERKKSEDITAKATSYIEKLSLERKSVEEKLKIELDSLKAAIDSTNCEKIEAEQKLDQIIQDLNHKVIALSADKDALLMSKDDLERQLESMQRSLDQSKTTDELTISDLKSQLLHLQKESAEGNETRAQVATMESEIIQLRQTISNLEEDYETLKKSKELSEIELNAERIRTQEITNKATAYIEKLNNQMKLADESYRIQLEGLISENSSNVTRLEQDIHRLNVNLAQVIEEKQLLLTNSQELERQLESMQQSLDQSKTTDELTISDLKSQLLHLQKESAEGNETRAQVTTMESEIIQLRQTISILEEDYKILKNSKDLSEIELNAERSRTQEITNKATAYIEKLNNEKKLADESFRIQLEGLISENSSNVTRLEQEIHRLNVNLAQVIEEKQLLLTNSQEVISLVTIHETKISGLLSQLTEKQMENNILCQNVASLEDELKVLKSNHDLLSKDLESERIKAQDNKMKVKAYVDSVAGEKKVLEDSLRQSTLLLQECSVARSTLDSQLIIKDSQISSLNEQLSSDRSNYESKIVSLIKDHETLMSEKDEAIREYQVKLQELTANSSKDVQEVLKMLEDSKIESEEHKAKRLIAKQEMLTAAKTLEQTESESIQLKNFVSLTINVMVNEQVREFYNSLSFDQLTNSISLRQKNSQRKIIKPKNNRSRRSINSSTIHSDSESNESLKNPILTSYSESSRVYDINDPESKPQVKNSNSFLFAIAEQIDVLRSDLERLRVGVGMLVQSMERLQEALIEDKSCANWLVEYLDCFSPKPTQRIISNNRLGSKNSYSYVTSDVQDQDL